MIKNLCGFLILILVILFADTIEISAQNSTGDVVHQSTISQNLSNPHRIALDNADNIYVADGFKKRIFIYNPAGILIDSISVGNEPLSMAFNNTNDLFVGDAMDGKIYKVVNGNATLFYVGCAMPSSMSFGTDGLLYVVDSKLKKVLALDVSANVVKDFGSGTLTYPSSIAIDERNNRILVSEHGGIGGGMTPVCKIWKYDLNGALLGSFGSAGNTNGKFYRIQGITIGRCGNIYVCDPYLGRISVFDENNIFKTSFGVFGDSLTQLNVPLGVVFDSQERILIPSMNNGRVEVFNILDSLPSASIINSDANICNGESTDIEIRFTGTAPWTITYTVDGLNPTQVITSDNPYYLSTSAGGIYEVSSLIDANDTATCFTGSAKINVFNQLPVSNLPDTTYVVCEGENVIIPLTLTGNPPWTFTYTVDGLNPQTVQTANNSYFINADIPGNYEITSLNDAGCSGLEFNGNAHIITNPKPVAAFSSGNARFEICSGDSIELGINLSGTPPWNLAYMVDEHDTTYVTTYNNFYSFYTGVQGSYDIISVYDSLCAGNYGTTYPEIIVNPLPTALLDSVTAAVCQGNGVVFPVHFTGNGPWTLSMIVGSDLITTVGNIEQNLYGLNVFQPGNYQLYSVSDANCTSDIVSGGAEIFHNALPAIELGTDSVLCEGNPVLLDAGPSLVYLWNDNSTQQTLSVSLSGVYSVTVTDSNGCFASDEIAINFQLSPVALFAFNSNLLEVTFQNMSLNSTSYVWDFGDGNTSTEENPVHIYSTPGTYTVSLTSSNGICADEVFTQTIIVSMVNIIDNDNSSCISIYPVPSDGVFNIVTNKRWNGNIKVEVLDIVGDLVYMELISDFGFKQSFDLQTLSKGIYTVVVTDQMKKHVSKLILQ